MDMRNKYYKKFCDKFSFGAENDTKFVLNH